MEDGDANLDIPERRRLLKDHQDAWENMEFTGDRIIDDLRSPFLRSYELQAGVLSQQTARRSLTFTQIPSEARGIPFASRSLDIDVNIADHTFDPSQNLLVIVEDLDMNALYACRIQSSSERLVTNEILNSTTHNVHLRNLRDGGTHRSASEPLLCSYNRYRHHGHDTRIIGPYVAVCWSNELLAIWEWKSGNLLLVRLQYSISLSTNPVPRCWNTPCLHSHSFLTSS